MDVRANIKWSLNRDSKHAVDLDFLLVTLTCIGDVVREIAFAIWLRNA